jgi:hypothetical protein
LSFATGGEANKLYNWIHFYDVSKHYIGVPMIPITAGNVCDWLDNEIQKREDDSEFPPPASILGGSEMGTNSEGIEI